MAQRVQVTINIGAGAPIESIRQVVDDLDTVCQFGGEMQYLAAVSRAELAVLRRPTAWVKNLDFYDYPYPTGAAVPLDWYGGPLPSGLLAEGVSRYLAENDPTPDTVTTVESIRYSNPIEIVLGACYLALAGLRLARDWPARRRVNAAVADDVESAVAFRKWARAEYMRRSAEEGTPLPAAQVNKLLTLDVAKAMKSLGDAQLNLHELAGGDDETESGSD